MNGIVIVDKPQGWTSQDVTARLRRVFNTRRIGHGGTLDPMATGVLPVFVGRATRGVEFFEHAEKTYEAVVRLGLATDTEDITGTVLEEKEVHISEAEFLGILPKFRGKIQQIPPMYGLIVKHTIAPLGHEDADEDGKCDRCSGQNYVEEDNSNKYCSCLCHKEGIMKIFYKIAVFFWKIFKMNPSCACGNTHY